MSSLICIHFVNFCMFNKKLDNFLKPFVIVIYAMKAFVFICSFVFCSDDGDFNVVRRPPAIVDHDGTVHWKPHAHFRPHCHIDVTFFPLDQQHCQLKFMSWSYDGLTVHLETICIQMRTFLDSAHWDDCYLFFLRSSVQGMLVFYHKMLRC